MLTNYFAVALRTLRKHKGHTATNVLGLVVGIACCLLIVLFVSSELSYKRFHERSDRLYRAYDDEQYEGDRQVLNTVTPIPMAPRLVSTFREVEAGVRLYAFTDGVRRGARQFTERMHLADSTFFEVFSFPLRQGNPATVLDQPGNVVLTEAMARKYFGDANPMGQTLTARIGGTMQELTVAGVAEAPPAASSIQFDILVPWAMNGFREASRQARFQVYAETYVRLREGASGEALEAKLPDMVRQGSPKDFEGQYAVGLQAITDQRPGLLVHPGRHRPRRTANRLHQLEGRPLARGSRLRRGGPGGLRRDEPVAGELRLPRGRRRWAAAADGPRRAGHLLADGQLTVSYQSLRAALSGPVEALRYE